MADTLESLAGSAAQAKNELAALRKEMAAAGGATAEFEIRLNAAEKAATSAQKAFRDMANAGTALEQLDAAFGRFQSGVQSIANAGTAVSGVVNQMVGWGNALAQGAAAAERHQRALDELGAGYDDIRRATNDTVSAEAAFRTEQELLQAGLRVSGDEMTTIARVARDYARAHNEDVGTAMEQLTRRLISGSERGLKPFGIEMHRGQNAADDFHQALGRTQDRLEGVPVAARTMNEEIEVTNRSFREAQDELESTAAQALHLTDIMHGLTAAFREASNNRGVFFAADAERDAAANDNNAMTVRGITTRAAAGVADARFGTNAMREIQAGNVGAAQAASFAQSLNAATTREQVQAAIDNLHEARDAVARERSAAAAEAHRADEEARREEHDRNERTRHGGGGGHHQRDDAATVKLQQEMRAENDRMVRESVEAEEQRIELVNALRQDEKRVALDAEQQAHDKQLALLEDSKRRMAAYDTMIRGIDLHATDAARDHALDQALKSNTLDIERVRARLNEIRDLQRTVTDGTQIEALEHEAQSLTRIANAWTDVRLAQQDAANFSLQASNTFRDSFHLMETNAQAASDVMRTAFSAFESSFKSHLAAVIEMRETVPEAFKHMVHEVTLQIAVESAWEAVLSTAKGFAALGESQGIPNPAAISFFTAAAGFTALAAGSAGVSMLTNTPNIPSGGAGGFSSPPSAARAGSPGSAGEGNGAPTYVFNINGAMSTEGIQDHILNLQDMAYRRTGRVPLYAQRAAA